MYLLTPNNEIGTLIPLRGSQKHEPDVSFHMYQIAGNWANKPCYYYKSTGLWAAYIFRDTVIQSVHNYDKDALFYILFRLIKLYCCTYRILWSSKLTIWNLANFTVKYIVSFLITNYYYSLITNYITLMYCF